MKTLGVYLEIDGEQVHVGDIKGNDYRDACFCYAESYLISGSGRPISISLPLTDEVYSAEKTRCFFEGLLPEGFSRRAVANWIKTGLSHMPSSKKSVKRFRIILLNMKI